MTTVRDLLRWVLPLGVVALLAGAVVPSALPPRLDSDLRAYAPAGLRRDPVLTVPTGERWQGTQTLLPALTAYDDLASPVREALPYGDDLAAAELQGRWLVVDLLPTGGDGSVQTLSFHVAPTRITLQAIQTPTTWDTFVPGLPVLDTAALDGGTVTWSGVATLTSGRDRRVRAPATATLTTRPMTDAPECVESRIALDYGTRGTGSRVSRWCRGTRAGWDADLVNDRGVERTAGPLPGTAADLSPQPEAPTVTSGRVVRPGYTRLVADGLYRSDPTNPRALTMAGSTLVAARFDGRVEAWSVAPESSAAEPLRYLRWRALPGGFVTALTAVGSLTVAGVTGDQVMAWSDDGSQVWELAARDLVTTLRPIGRAVLVTDAAGEVRLVDAATGTVRWTRSFGPGARVEATAGAVAVVAGEELTVLDDATGRTRWTRRVGPDADMAVTADVVVTRVDGWLVARAATDGGDRWWRPVERLFTAVTSGDDRIVVVSPSATRAYAPDGRVLWTADAALEAVHQGPVTALTFDDRLETWGPVGRIRSWPYPAGFGAPDEHLVITGEGVQLYQPSPDGSRWWEYR